MLYRFNMAAKYPIFISRHFDFCQILKKKTLSQRNFSMKFGSKKENMNRFMLLK